MLNNSLLTLLVIVFLPGMVNGEEISIHSFIQAIRLIDDPDVRAELEISDEQFLEINKNWMPLKRRSSPIILGLRSQATAEVNRNKILADDFVANGSALIRKTLVEFQYKRLIQIARQHQSIGQLPVYGLAEADEPSPFNFDKETKLKIQRVEKSVESEIKALHEKFESEIQILLEGRDEKLKAVMSMKQQRQYDARFGKPFSKFLEIYMVSRSWRQREISEKILQNLKAKPPVPKSLENIFKRKK